MSNFQPVIITAVIAVAALAWVLVCAFIIGLAVNHRTPQHTAPPTETPSSVDCPVHGPDCEAWL